VLNHGENRSTQNLAILTSRPIATKCGNCHSKELRNRPQRDPSSRCSPGRAQPHHWRDCPMGGHQNLVRGAGLVSTAYKSRRWKLVIRYRAEVPALSPFASSASIPNSKVVETGQGPVRALRRSSHSAPRGTLGVAIMVRFIKRDLLAFPAMIEVRRRRQAAGPLFQTRRETKAE